MSPVARTRAVAVLLALPLLAAGPAWAQPAEGSGVAITQPAPTFAVTGRGWGHGVGMSQWGAYGFARQGSTYDRILAHYYAGTALARAPVSRVRVLLLRGRRTLTIGSSLPFRVRDGAGALHDVDSGVYRLGPALRLPVRTRAKPKGKAKPQPPAPRLRNLPGPLLVSAGDAPLELNGKRYRGAFELEVFGKRLRAINVVGLEAYLYGVVPDEMPHDWLPEALRAQAVVARSYALAVRRGGDFDLFADVRSQVYGGVDAEEWQSTAAVEATRGQVLTYGDRIATTFFFSTSGGRTASIADVWPGSRPTPYLVSVQDPYDGISPHHSWGPLLYTSRRLARELGVKGELLDVRTVLNGSGRVERVVGVGVEGEEAVLASELRRRLELRSTYFRVGVLSLHPPGQHVPYGTALQLAGIARDLPNVVLQQRAASSLWQTAAVLRPAADGTFVVSVKPLALTEYRLVSGSIASAPVHASVTPVVSLALIEPNLLRGRVRPALTGATVIVQRLAGPIWRDVAGASVDPRGGFEARVQIQPGGSYRARLAVPARGLAPGVSPTLMVPGS
ncbi:MAG: SpoIID/LytB domain-containing protein [Actinobacteria bacterium]|nr:SpoIID/LytB domain-containing protein [Actinomycetota bacterium]